MERINKELIGHTEAMEKAHGIGSKESDKLRAHAENGDKINILKLLPSLVEILSQMSIGFLCAKGSSKFVTSDDPCSLFNPDLQWQRFYGPGLQQKNVQLTLPLSPSIALCLSWSPLRGYVEWGDSEVEEFNRMTVGHCYKYFVSHNSKVRRHWFRAYPLDFFFILKILKHQVEMRIHKLVRWYKYDRHVRTK